MVLNPVDHRAISGGIAEARLGVLMMQLIQKTSTSSLHRRAVAKRLSEAGSIVLAFGSLIEGKESTILTVLSTCSMVEIGRPG
jgi:hypothetical protein